MLVGLVTKNAILLLDVALRRVSEGGDLLTALVEAARVRFRPIIMTTMTVVVISIPLMVGAAQGAEFRKPLGLVILSGVLTSALLTFFVVPSTFYLFERRRYERLGAAAVPRAMGASPAPEGGPGGAAREAGGAQTPAPAQGGREAGIPAAGGRTRGRGAGHDPARLEAESRSDTGSP